MEFPIRRLRTQDSGLRTCRAFTIVELMVSIALVLMLMGVAVFIFISTVKIFVKTSAETELYQAAQVAMETVRRDIQGCIPLLTQDQAPNGQQFVVQFDTDAAGVVVTPPGYAAPWRFDRLCFRTTTADPATGASADRWVFYWVQGADKTVQDGRPGTLMKYVSPGQIPPWKSGALGAVFGAGVTAAPDMPGGQGAPDWPANWFKDDAELCQNVTFFGVEVFYDPDAVSATTGQFFSDATATVPTGIRSYDPYRIGVSNYDADVAALVPGAVPPTSFNPYVIVGSPSYLALNAYSSAGYPAPIVHRAIRLPTQLRVTLRIRDRDKNASVERTLQFQVGIPVAN